MALGRHHTNASFYLKGRLFGLALVGRTLSAGELEALEVWLAQRAGL